MTHPHLRLEPGPDRAVARVALQGIEKRFGGRSVLRGVDLTLRPGRVTALVGPNGAGKSTLVRVLLGLVRPDAGEVRIDGVAIAPGAHAHRADFGYMPQHPSLPGNLTGREVLKLLQSLRPATAGLDETLIGRFGLALDLDRPTETLSGGTRQKLSAVLAFLFRPRILLLDEPTAGLDPVARVVLKDRISELRDGGAAILLSSHVLAELEDLADDVLLLVDGGVRFDGSVGDLVRRTRTTRLERAVAAMAAEPGP